MGLTFEDPMLVADSQGIFRPGENGNPLLADMIADTGSFSLPLNDMDGQTRSNATTSGADEISMQVPSTTDLRGVLSPELVGPLSFEPPAAIKYLNNVAIANPNFDNQSLAAWTNNGSAITNLKDEVFSRGSSVKLDNQSDSLSQTVAVESDTNYTLSAFVKG